MLDTYTSRGWRNWRQLIEISSVWIQGHYERLILFIAITILFGSIAGLTWDAIRLGRDLSIVSSVLPQKPPVRLHQIVELEEALTRLSCPSQWTFTGRSGLFVPERHFVGTNGFPTTLRATAAHPPVPNGWLEEFQLPIAVADVLLQDPDGDGFSNREEWEHQTNPTQKESHPSFIAKLKLKSVANEPFRLVFASRVGETFAINTNDLKEPTQFLRLGQAIRGTKFKLARFDEKFEVNGLGTRVDVSELALENTETREPLILVKEKVKTSPFPVVTFVYLWGGRMEFTVRKEQQFSLRPEDQIKYRLIDVHPAKAIVVNIRKPTDRIEIGLLDPPQQHGPQGRAYNESSQ